jgi:Family of unknown function (DUF6325)
VTRGPVEVAVIAFGGGRFRGDIAPALAQAVDRGVMRVIDLVFVSKRADGVVEAAELDDVDADVADALWPLTDEVAGLLSEDDVREVGERLRPGDAAAMVVFEHAWLSRLGRAIADANGRMLAHERIPAEVVERAAAARAAAG